MVKEGSVTLVFPGEENVTLRSGDMLVIPPSKPHGVEVGPQRCTVMDLFSPLRQDFIDGSAAYLREQRARMRKKQTRTDGFTASCEDQG